MGQLCSKHDEVRLNLVSDEGGYDPSYSNVVSGVVANHSESAASAVSAPADKGSKNRKGSNVVPIEIPTAAPAKLRVFSTTRPQDLPVLPALSPLRLLVENNSLADLPVLESPSGARITSDVFPTMQFQSSARVIILHA